MASGSPELTKIALGVSICLLAIQVSAQNHDQEALNQLSKFNEAQEDLQYLQCRFETKINWRKGKDTTSYYGDWYLDLSVNGYNNTHFRSRIDEHTRGEQMILDASIYQRITHPDKSAFISQQPADNLGYFNGYVLSSLIPVEMVNGIDIDQVKQQYPTIEVIDSLSGRDEVVVLLKYHKTTFEQEWEKLTFDRHTNLLLSLEYGYAKVDIRNRLRRFYKKIRLSDLQTDKINIQAAITPADIPEDYTVNIGSGQ